MSVVVVAIAAAAVAVLLIGYSEATAHGSPHPSQAVPVVVVHRGDTLWTIARRLHPQGDVRNTVARLSHARMQSGPLAVGERIPFAS